MTQIEPELGRIQIANPLIIFNALMARHAALRWSLKPRWKIKHSVSFQSSYMWLTKPILSLKQHCFFGRINDKDPSFDRSYQFIHKMRYIHILIKWTYKFEHVPYKKTELLLCIFIFKSIRSSTLFFTLYSKWLPFEWKKFYFIAKSE